MNKDTNYYYINIMNFGGTDLRVSCEISLFELSEFELNTILNDYMIRFKVSKELYQEIYKLLYKK